MADPAILVAARAKLATIADLPPVVWPNEEIKYQPPFLIWDNGPIVGTPITLDGLELFEFRPQVSLLVESGTFTADGDAVLWSIAQEFKINTRFEYGGAHMARCMQTPVPDNGRPDKGFYRRDMTLRIAAFHQF